MNALRGHIHRHRWLASMIIAMTLLMKVVVPAGFMPFTNANGVTTIQICTGMGAQTIQIALPGGTGQHEEQDRQHKADQPCAFSSLAAPSLAAVDAVLLAGAIAFLFALVFRGLDRPVGQRPAYLRPPLRGPPVQA